MANIEATTEYTPEEAAEIIEAMREAVNSVPSYVETNAYQQWLLNQLESNTSNRQ